MIPEVGSKWLARDGRVMIVKSVVVPEPDVMMPYATLRVVNATGRMRRETQMKTDNFGTDLSDAFLRPCKE